MGGAVWRQMGSPENVRLVELGPGRGTMMLDALRAVQVVPAFRKAVVVHLVEISPALEAAPAAGAVTGIDVPVDWHQTLEAGAGRPDDHPRQRILRRAAGASGGDVRRRLARARGARSATTASLQFSSARDPIPLFDQMLPRSRAQAADRRRSSNGAPTRSRSRSAAASCATSGAALVIDYGHVESAAGDTLQAVGAHAFADPLVAPGHGRPHRPCGFPGARPRRPRAWARASTARSSRANSCAGSASRPARGALKAGAPAGKDAEHRRPRWTRLTSEERTGMGRLFKVIGIRRPEARARCRASDNRAA